MYHTTGGERILLGSERELFEDALGMIVDELSFIDVELGIPAFDNLQRGQKLFALYRAGRALLHPDEPLPERSAFLEAAIAAVYQRALGLIILEIDDPEFIPLEQSWRKLALEAARESNSDGPWPDVSSEDEEEWEFVIDSLTDNVILDRDFELEAHLDADPEASRKLKGILGISNNYYAAVPHDPREGSELNLYVDALQGLTPRGRGATLMDDDVTNWPDDEPF